jgi:hypothetical protein
MDHSKRLENIVSNCKDCFCKYAKPVLGAAIVASSLSLSAGDAHAQSPMGVGHNAQMPELTQSNDHFGRGIETETRRDAGQGMFERGLNRIASQNLNLDPISGSIYQCDTQHAEINGHSGGGIVQEVGDHVDQDRCR